MVYLLKMVIFYSYVKLPEGTSQQKKCGQGKKHGLSLVHSRPRRVKMAALWMFTPPCRCKFIAPGPSPGNSIPTHAPIVLKCIKYPLVCWIYLYIYDQEGTYLSIITTNETPTHDICIIIILYIYNILNTLYIYINYINYIYKLI